MISVLICAHRPDDLLIKCVKSVSNQTFQKIEILVICNGVLSFNKKFQKILKAIDKRIKVFDVGWKSLSECLNLGIHKSQFDLIAKIDSDDEMLPNRLTIQYEYMLNNPKISVLGTNYRVNNLLKNKIYSKKVLTNKFFINTSLFFFTTIAHPTVMYRKIDVIESGGYETVDFAEDWDLWLKMRRKGFKLINIPIETTLYTVHSNQLSQSLQKEINGCIAILLKNFFITKNPTYIISILFKLSLYVLRFIKNN